MIIESRIHELCQSPAWQESEPQGTAGTCTRANRSVLAWIMPEIVPLYTPQGVAGCCSLYCSINFGSSRIVNIVSLPILATRRSMNIASSR